MDVGRIGLKSRLFGGDHRGGIRGCCQPGRSVFSNFMPPIDACKRFQGGAEVVRVASSWTLSGGGMDPRGNRVEMGGIVC